MASHTGNSTRPLVGARRDVQEVSGQPPEGREAACEISLAIARRHVIANPVRWTFLGPGTQVPDFARQALEPKS
jgi:hypothetical protein